MIEKDEAEKEKISELEEEDFVGGSSEGSGEVVKRRRPKPAAASPLPPGWEKHTDEGGDYYWHVKSGTIQRQVGVTNAKYIYCLFQGVGWG